MVSVKTYIARKILFLLITLYIVITINFVLPRLMPGSPIDYFLKDPSITPEERSRLIARFGLDKDIFTQYYMYLINTLKGDLGVSFRYYPTPVVDVLLSRLPWTIYLLGTTYTISTILGIMLGAVAGWKRGKRIDIGLSWLAFLTRSMPIFWLGMIILYIFSAELGLFPLSGALTPGAEYPSPLHFIYDVARHSVLPMMTIIIFLIGPPILLTRNLVADTLTEPYVSVARAKGLGWRTVVFKHALRPVSLPLSTYTAILLGYVVGGAVFTETVFSWPGVGRLIYEAIMRRDYPLIQGSFYIIAISVLLANFIVDLLYSVIDPRVRLQ